MNKLGSLFDAKALKSEGLELTGITIFVSAKKADCLRVLLAQRPIPGH